MRTSVINMWDTHIRESVVLAVDILSDVIHTMELVEDICCNLAIALYDTWQSIELLPRLPKNFPDPSCRGVEVRFSLSSSSVEIRKLESMEVSPPFFWDL